MSTKFKKTIPLLKSPGNREQFQNNPKRLVGAEEFAHEMGSPNLQSFRYMRTKGVIPEPDGYIGNLPKWRYSTLEVTRERLLQPEPLTTPQKTKKNKGA